MILMQKQAEVSRLYRFLMKQNRYYYGLKMDSICRKIRYRYKFKYDLNAILSDLIYTRVLEPSGKLLLSRLHSNSWRHQPMNSMISTAPFLSLQKSVILYSLKFTKTVSSWGRETIKFFIMIAQTTTSRLNRKTVIKSMERKEHRPNPIIQMGLFTDGDGIPLELFLFSPAVRMNRSP